MFHICLFPGTGGRGSHLGKRMPFSFAKSPILTTPKKDILLTTRLPLSVTVRKTDNTRCCGQTSRDFGHHKLRCSSSKVLVLFVFTCHTRWRWCMTLSAPENEKVLLDLTASHAVKRKPNDKNEVIFVYTLIHIATFKYVSSLSDYSGFGFRSRFAQEKAKTKIFTKYLL